MGVSVGTGVLVGIGVNVDVGVDVGGSALGVLVNAWNGVADEVAVKEGDDDTCGSVERIFAWAMLEHPINKPDKPTIHTTSKILCDRAIDSLIQANLRE